MGKLYQGINGPFSGKVGTVIGYTWKGIPVIRSLPVRKNVSFSPAVLNQQAKFKMLSGFLHDIIPLLNITYAHLAIQKTPFNMAYSFNLKNAFSGVLPDLKIDYSMAKISRGDLPNAFAIATAYHNGFVEIQWTDNSLKGKALETDRAFVAVYNVASNEWIYEVSIANRKDSTCKLDVIKFSGKNMHAYIGFISADGKEVSESFYAGEFNAPVNQP